MPDADVTPFPASTVVLLRDGFHAIEAFMVRRHESLAFMGGAYVFPGGRVDEDDRGADDPEGFRFAAIRELFEEAGVLLAIDARGHHVAVRDERTRARFEQHRRHVLAGAVGFRQALAVEQLRPDFAALVPCAHWITPPRMSRRFDTRFFAARMPRAQTALHDQGETIESAWIAPADALERAAAGRMELPPPTSHTLHELARFPSVNEALSFYGGRAIERHEPQ